MTRLKGEPGWREAWCEMGGRVCIGGSFEPSNNYALCLGWIDCDRGGVCEGVHGAGQDCAWHGAK